jgi:hypothetical protein
MRSAVRVVLAAPILAILVATSSTAQSLTPCVHQIIFTTEREIFAVTRGNVRPAYTATVKQTYEQKLADGNTIHWTIEAIQARDEAGRTMRQHVQGCDADAGGSPLRIQTSVYDPASKSTINWITGPGSRALTTIFHQPEPLAAPQAPPDAKDFPLTPSTQYKPQLTREDLGTSTIAGMEATGTRVTEIIPAGFLGNDMPLKAVHETWMDSKSHTILMAIDDDPRNFGGRRTWEVESLTIGPPDPSLFAPPANYKVWDQYPRPQTTTDAKP